MTDEQRVRAAFGFRPVDRVPVVALDAGTWIVDREGLSYEELFSLPGAGAELIVRAYDEMDSDTVWASGGTVFMLGAVGVPVRLDLKGRASECAPALSDPKQIGDLDFPAIPARLGSDPNIRAIMKQIAAVRESVHGRKLVATCGCTAFTTAARMAGVENLLVWLMDGEEALPRLFDYAVELCAGYNALAARSGADLVMFGDPVASADMIGAQLYRQEVRPLEARVAERGEAPFQFLHICGNSAPRLPHAHGMKVGGFSLDNVDLSDALAEAGGDFAILGNISPAYLKSAEVSDIRGLCEARCRLAGLKGGFLLANGCDVVPGTPIEHLRAMKAAAQAAAARP